MIVYDIDGNEYEYNEEKCKRGHIVYPIIHCEYADGEEYTSKEDPIIIDTIYKIPPIQKKSEEIVKLEEKVKLLKDEISALKKKKKVYDDLMAKSTEDIIREKLSEYPSVIKLVDMLAKVTKPVRLSTSNYINEVNEYIAINPKTNKIILVDSYGYRINEKDYGEVFDSVEEAENKMLDNIIKYPYNNYQYSYKRMLELEELFKKYNKNKPKWWEEKFIQIKTKEIEDKQSRLKQCEHDIKYNTERIEKLKKELEEIDASNNK